ncbi:hypothetical protein V2J09_002856 [Rumex salicifolius]
MSASVCGKRSFFEELPSPSTSKRVRRSSTSPVRKSPSRSASGSIAVVSSSSSSPLLNHLISHFPDMDMKLLERALEECEAPKNLPRDGTEWVELFVKEMASAANLDDARVRATRALESLEKSITTRVSSEVSHEFRQENTVLKEQIGVLIHENTILKRAVSIQHERQKEFDDKIQEIQHLKQLISQYQQQLRTLEVNNYALSMHLKQAQQSNSIPGRYG